MRNRPKSRYIVDLPKHLAVCEGNYHRILKLTPNLKKNANEAASTQRPDRDEIPIQQWRYSMSGFNGDLANKGLELSIIVSEIAKYTTMLNICVAPSAISSSDAVIDEALVTNNLDNNLLAVLASYSLDVRLYHDAQLAEVVTSKGCRQFKARHEYPNQEMHQADEKSQLNQFLGELIVFCLVKGRVAYDVISA